MMVTSVGLLGPLKGLQDLQRVPSCTVPETAGILLENTFLMNSLHQQAEEIHIGIFNCLV